MKYSIYRLLNENHVDETSGKPIPHLEFISKYEKPKKAEIVRKDAQDGTLIEFVELCDQDAESCNSHEFTGSHLALAALLLRHVPVEKATDILHHVARLGGLHKMSGNQVDEDCAPDLGIGKSLQEWDGELNPPQPTEKLEKLKKLLAKEIYSDIAESPEKYRDKILRASSTEDLVRFFEALDPETQAAKTKKLGFDPRTLLL